MIAKAEKVETVVTIYSVTADRFDQKSFSIEALVPDFTTPDRSIPTKYIKWVKTQGNAPEKDSQGLAVLAPTMIQKRHVDSGKYSDNVITGEEMAYEVNWEMLSFERLEANAPSQPTGNTYQSNNRILNAPVSRPVDGTLRHKVDSMMINDRESIRLVIAHGQCEGGNTYTSMEDVLKESEPVAEWLNNRFLLRMAGDSPLLKSAIDSGAEIIDVVPNDALVDYEQLSMDEAEKKASSVPKIKDEKELRDWITSKSYTKKQITDVLSELKVERVTEYLAQNGNTAYGLALILHEKLGDNVPW